MNSDSASTPIGVPPLHIWSVRILAAIGGLAMASTGECEMLFLLVFLSFFLIGIRIEKLPFLQRIMGIAQPYLAALVFLVALADFFFLSNSFLLSAAHFLLCLQGLQLLVLRTPRENLGAILISSLMILSASTLAVEWTFFFIMTFYLPVLIWTLMLQTIVQDQAGVMVENSLATLPSHPSHLFQKSPLWNRMVPALRKSAFSAFSVAVVCCAVIFVVFPRFNFRGFRGQFLQPVHKTAFTNQVDLAKSGRIYTDDSIVMRVEIPPEDRRKWPGYVKGSTLEIFDGRLWRRAPYTHDRIYQVNRGEFHLPPKGDSLGQRLKQSIYLESMDSPILFAVSWPAIIRIDRPVLEASQDGTLQRFWGDSWRIHYEVESFLPPARDVLESRRTSARWPRKAPPSASSYHRQFEPNEDYALDLPSPAFVRVRELSQQIVGSIEDPLEAAVKIESYLSKNYSYTLNFSPLSANNNPLEYFLFESRKGHCEFFASAMCLLLRYQGIPARVATGFFSREWNDRGHYYVVRMKNAHAWVEAFIEPYGWVSFDPSPQPEIGLGDSNIGRRMRETWDYLNLRWNRYILSYDFERQKSIVESVTQHSEELSSRLGRFGSIFGGKFLRFNSIQGESIRKKVTRVASEAPGFFFLLLGSVCVFWLALVKLKSRKSASKQVWLGKKLLRILEKKGGPKPPSITIKEFSESLSEQFGTLARDVHYLQERYYQLRFNPLIKFTTDEEAGIRSALQRLS